VDLSDTFCLPSYVEDIALSQLGEKYEEKKMKRENKRKKENEENQRK
jgi:hypothetical protein